MRILVLTPDLSQSGGVTNYYNALRLSDSHDVDYFFVNKQHTKSIASKVYYAIFIYLGFLREAISCQLIHINPSLNLKSFYRDMIFIFISRILGKKVLIFFHGWEDDFQKSIKNSRLMSYLFRHTYAKANRYIVLSKEFKSKLITLGVSEDTPFHIETTVADSSYIKNFDIKEKIKSADNHINCLFISRILKDKGIYIAIDAFVKCQEEMSGHAMTFNIAGNGDELEAVQNYVNEKGWSNINFTGHVSGNEKMQLLEKNHIMIFPTYYGEGLPSCILEGMLYGMPIISRINAGIPDVVEHGVNGYLTESIDSSVFAGFLRDIILDKDMYSKIAFTNHNKAQEEFTTEKVRERILSIYDLMLNSQ